MRPNEKIQKGSENIFRDIGSAYPERLLTRAKTMFQISQIIKDRGLTQDKAAKLLGIPQSKVSCLMNGKLSLFSLEHLFELLNALDSDVEIIIKPKGKEERIATTNIVLAAIA